MFLLGGLISPSFVSDSTKVITKLDKLAYFVRNHSNNSEVVSYHIASAILNTTHPRTIASIALVESEFTPNAVGDSGASVGMFQIQPAVWGEVSSSIYEQARKADLILTEVKMIRRYNGAGRQARRYEAKVLSTRRQINL